MKYFLLFLLPLSLYASKILSYNIYDRTDRADIMLTFDTPFQGSIKESKSKNRIIIKLGETSIESTKTKKLSSHFLHSIQIIPLKNQVQIIANIASDVKLIASRTSDAYGLRLRFTKKSTRNNTTQENSSSRTDLSALPTKQEMQITTNYYLVVGSLFLAIILLFIFKNKLQKGVHKQPKNSWLFNSIQENPVANTQEPAQKVATQTPSEETTEVTIRFQKAINNANSVVMLDFGKESYLVLMGNGNILLDKFRDNKPTSEQEFNEILQERNQELEDFIGSASTSSATSHKEPLQAYKERAASLIYGDEE